MNILPGDYVLFNTGVGYRLLGNTCFSHSNEGQRSFVINLAYPSNKISTKPAEMDRSATVERVELRPLHVYDETAARIDGLPVTFVAAYVPHGWSYDILKTSMIASKLIYDDEHPRRSRIWAAEEMIKRMPPDERRTVLSQLMYLVRE